VQSEEIKLKVLGYLGRALSLELSAVQSYTTQSRLTANWGFDKAAEQFRHEALEEMQHVERIIARMLSKGAAPGASQLRPAILGNDLMALVEINQRFEEELVIFYQEAVSYCASNGQLDDRLFFQQLLDEEQEHAVSLKNWRISLQNQAS
jgi:bacterioferritin